MGTAPGGGLAGEGRTERPPAPAPAAVGRSKYLAQEQDNPFDDAPRAAAASSDAEARWQSINLGPQ